MDLADLTDALKRAAAPLGQFDSYFPDATDDDVVGMLMDSFAEAQLDGFLAKYELTVESATVEPALDPGKQALVVLYGMARILTAQIANLKNKTRYKAGNVEAETEQSALVLVELLKQTNTRKRQILDDLKAGNVTGAFAMADLYITRSIDDRYGWY